MTTFSMILVSYQFGINATLFVVPATH